MAKPKSRGAPSTRQAGTALSLPKPFRAAPSVLEPFYSTLSEKHVYIAHLDLKPKAFKRKIFVVPVLMNVAVVLLFLWRVRYIGPYYVQLLASALGYANETTVASKDLAWGELISLVLRRGFTFMLDLCLVIFVWPWPVEFCFARGGNPVAWRWKVGFRDKEIYVRRSRDWDRTLGDFLYGDQGRNVLLSMVKLATNPMLLREKTGYLTMNGDWDLDWGAMVCATTLVDNKAVAMDTFRTLVLLHSDQHGWLSLDMNADQSAKEDDRRRQVFAFRDGLARIGKEELFFRWIEMMQFESSQPSGFGPEKQVEVAAKVRELFQSNGVDFDEFWKESVGSDPADGL
ncbi:uncharacterized protein E0L32_002634 [Thyridium curvatum]|uniref:Uncharacterized protein n=1 Tax=Thyridium curvatum TaxID=1093900 RepID=A0A507B4R6_9PEZI|nr:uncharacterized protein E0L32_002634 [Thyridium curvatum]TPX18125.1 hypothetical protein E0L32_002634 [Thyridium curvatum]